MTYDGEDEITVEVMGHPVEVAISPPNMMRIGYADGSDGPLFFSSPGEWERFASRIDELVSAAQALVANREEPA